MGVEIHHKVLFLSLRVLATPFDIVNIVSIVA